MSRWFLWSIHEGYKQLSDFVAAAKAKAGQLFHYASAGAGNSRISMASGSDGQARLRGGAICHSKGAPEH